MDVVEAAHVGWAEVTIRMLVALLVGAIVGLEREADGHEAGIRTHMLLALGAATFGVVSVGGFGEFALDTRDTNVTIDVTRIASYVAAGIGFLGGGAILKREDHVRGLTTAASLWTVAAAGLAAGIGYLTAALIVSVMAVVVLLAERPLRALARWLRPPGGTGGDVSHRH